MSYKLYLIVGIQTNYRSLLNDAITKGEDYGFCTQILDLSGLVKDWSAYPNEWSELGIEEHVTSINNLSYLSEWAKMELDPQSIVLFLYAPIGPLRTAWNLLARETPNVGMITLSPVPDSERMDVGNKLQSLLRRIINMGIKAKSFFKPFPKFWMVSGTQCIPTYRSYFRSFRNTRFIYAHSIEYELFNYREPRGTRIQNNQHTPFILVLDQGWYSKPKPDFLTESQYPPAPRDKFSREMRSLLSKLRENTGLRIIISCHPKADLQDTCDLYTGFDVTDDSSAELIRDCKLVVATTSTSISYAVIANKPLILVTSDELLTSIVNPAQLAISRELEIDYVNISHPYDVSKIKDGGSTKKYNHYTKRYIRQSRASNKPVWDILYTALIP